MREYNIDFGKPDEVARETLRMHIDTLKSFRGTTPHPVEMEWEIRVYEYILEDPAKRLKEYQNARYGIGDGCRALIPKREAIKTLGWVIE